MPPAGDQTENTFARTKNSRKSLNRLGLGNINLAEDSGVSLLESNEWSMPQALAIPKDISSWKREVHLPRYAVTTNDPKAIYMLARQPVDRNFSSTRMERLEDRKEPVRSLPFDAKRTPSLDLLLSLPARPPLLARDMAGMHTACYSSDGRTLGPPMSVLRCWVRAAGAEILRPP
jgi:hypothetical protein